MASYNFRAYSANGDLVEGEIEAKNNKEAEEKLIKRGLTPFETPKLKNIDLYSWLSWSNGALSARQISSFTREFATLEMADVPLEQSLRILAAHSLPALRKLSQDILVRIVNRFSPMYGTNLREYFLIARILQRCVSLKENPMNGLLTLLVTPVPQQVYQPSLTNQIFSMKLH